MTIANVDYSMVLKIPDGDGQLYCNQWYWKAQGGFVGNSEDLANAFVEDVLPALEDVVHTTMGTTAELIVKSLYDPSNFFQGTAPFSGNRTGEYLPNFNTWAFKLNRPRTDMRNGRKSFGRISESDVNNGIPATSGSPSISDLLDTLAAAMASTIERATSPQSNYKICIPVSTLVDLGGGVFGRVVDTLYQATGVVFSHVGTQNSRKNY